MGPQNISLESMKNESGTHVQTNDVDDKEDYAQDGAHVKAKYMGTIADQREMSVLGRTQVLRVRMPPTELSNRPD